MISCRLERWKPWLIPTTFHRVRVEVGHLILLWPNYPQWQGESWLETLPAFIRRDGQIVAAPLRIALEISSMQ